MKTIMLRVAIIEAVFGMSGCAVYSVADATVSVAAMPVETTADVAAAGVDPVVTD